MKEYFIAWWNVENLFDAADIPDRERKVAAEIGSEIDGWTIELRDKKIGNLASIIKEMNSNKGPDMIGVCEIENRHVLDALKDAIAVDGRTYNVAHVEGPDPRGIDVAFIYDEKKFKLKPGAIFSHEVLKRSSTRNILQVDFETNDGNILTVMGNHWPSRKSGTYESEGYRIVAAETLSYWNLRSQEVAKAPILVMGDFNDEPIDRSLTKYALSTPSKMKVKKAKEAPRLLNLMWSIMAQGVGTFYYSNWPFMFDQFLVSRGFLKDDATFTYSSVKIFTKSKMTKGEYKVPKKFGLPKKGVDETGYSDHFPITVKITEK